MRITVAAVGRTRSGPHTTLFRTYTERSSWPIVLKEIDIRRKLPPERLRVQEADALLAAVPAGARVLALDERGDDMDSAAFAAQIGRWRDIGVGDVAFLIGGADGLDDVVRTRADRLVAFGRMTWPHLLARTMLVEQIYRAQTILAGHPYHRE